MLGSSRPRHVLLDAPKATLKATSQQTACEHGPVSTTLATFERILAAAGYRLSITPVLD